jgi:uncharacterized protein (TIGR01777 family)
VTIVIAGGSGFLGTALVKAWRTEGHRVVVLTRQPRHRDDVEWSVEGGSWTAALDGADAVVNLAGEGIADRRWSAARKGAILESRVRATRAIVSAIQSARTPPGVLLNASAIGIYGVRGDEPVTEDTPPGSDFLGMVCREWEAQANVAATSTRVVLLRTGVVLARHGGALPQMARPFWFLVGGPLGTGRQYVSWIHLTDWVALVRWAMTGSSVAGPLNLTAPNPVTNAEFSRALARALHRPGVMRAPAFALRAALGEMAEALLLGGQRVVPANALRLGFEFRYPLLEPALRDIYDGMRRQPR